jgi:hypothetical protein
VLVELLLLLPFREVLDCAAAAARAAAAGRLHTVALGVLSAGFGPLPCCCKAYATALSRSASSPPL